MKVGQMVEKVFLELARPVSFHSATGEDVGGGGGGGVFEDTSW